MLRLGRFAFLHSKGGGVMGCISGIQLLLLLFSSPMGGLCIVWVGGSFAFSWEWSRGIGRCRGGSGFSGFCVMLCTHASLLVVS